MNAENAEFAEMDSDSREPTAADLNLLSGQIIEAAIAVHSELGPGLLESAYELCLLYKLPIAD